MKMENKIKSNTGYKTNVETPKIHIIDYIFLGFMLVLPFFRFFFMSSEMGYAYHISIEIIPAIVLFVLIFLKFSRENRAKISSVLGVTGLIFFVLSFYGRFDIFIELPFLFSVFGWISGVIGIKSSKKKLAVLGIILNSLVVFIFFIIYTIVIFSRVT